MAAKLTGRWALGWVVLGGHRQLVLVRPSGAMLLLHVLHYPEQVRACPRAAGPRSTGSREEMHLAGVLIDAASEAVDWPSYRDETAQKLRGLVEAKLQGQPAAAVELENRVLPLLEALRQSVAGPEATGATQGRRQARVPRERYRSGRQTRVGGYPSQWMSEPLLGAQVPNLGRQSNDGFPLWRETHLTLHRGAGVGNGCTRKDKRCC